MTPETHQQQEKRMSSLDRPTRTILAATLALAGLASGPAYSHGDAKDGHERKIDYSKAEEHDFGKAADPALATRTVVIEMSDRMRFTPDRVEIGRGEIVRFEIRNAGQLQHEMVLGSAEELEQHAAMMRKFPGMEHDEPYMAHVAPGEMSVMGWQFTRAGEYHYGCLLPGHFEAGMKGTVIVR
jgi:uncharacterized cupredoxin-like copper-binding protein